MDVIGNNVSNVNTNGFKKGRVTFQDILSQTMTGAARPTEERGGLNPRQVGLGMSVASIDTIHTQGSLQTTGRNTDLAITGDGFFVMQRGERTFYTRSGNFMLDSKGTLVNANGYRVQGWNAITFPDGTRFVNTSSPMEDLIIPLGEKLEARETSTVRFKSNLNAETPVLPENPSEQEFIMNTHATSQNIFDRYGNSRRMLATFERTDLNEWLISIEIDGIDAETISVNVGEPKADTNNQLVMNFNTNGTIASITEAEGAAIETDGEGLLQATVLYALPDGTTHTFNLNLGESGEISDSITQFSAPTTTRAYEQDGYTMGYLESFRIDDSGTITGVYDNDQRRTIGQLAVSTFVNPGGMEKSGESMFLETNNSGGANTGAAGTEGRGSLYAGALEMSNVDLAETFTDMIVTERGFQANSRVVTTTDDMLREILGLKR
jgi:flagellar hook protein FlgE